MSNNKKLTGKIAVITGGSTGIGLATAQLFAQEGAYVYINGRRKDELDAAVSLIGPQHVTAVRGDVSNLADLDNLYDRVKREKGRIDIIFANAGILDTSPLGSITEDHFDKLFNINVKGVVFTVQKALPLLSENASIILNGSAGSVKGNPGCSIYSATKAALRALVRNWVVDFKGRQIRFNVISPGPIDTPIFNVAGVPQEQAKQLKEHIGSNVPMGRFGTPEEIAKAVLFLASNDSSFINGIELFVDGGIAQV